MTAWTILALVLGLGVLTGGAEALVRGAARLGARAGISPLVVGLTIVALGTSAPELVVSVYASLEGKADIAVANVVGSNIFNILFVLGLCALLVPLVASAQILRREVPICIGLSLAVGLMCLDGRIGLLEGLALAAGAVAYFTIAVWIGRVDAREARDRGAAAQAGAQPIDPIGLAPAAPARAWPRDIALVAAGLGMLVLGARWLVTGAIDVARLLGVSDAIIGLTIVAVGTSLPEVATSVVATIRGQRDIAIGNAIGSCICNILVILGVSALASGGNLAVSPALARFDVLVMIAAAVACLPLLRTGGVLARWEGALLLGYYAAYLAYLTLAAQQHDALADLRLVMITFVIPLTTATIAITVVQSMMAHRQRVARARAASIT